MEGGVLPTSPAAPPAAATCGAPRGAASHAAVDPSTIASPTLSTTSVPATTLDPAEGVL